jgi:hypothetical protein
LAMPESSKSGSRIPKKRKSEPVCGSLGITPIDRRASTNQREGDAMWNDTTRTANADGTARVKRGFWARFWESLRASLGSSCL